jgi:competence protein ComEC
MKYFVSLYIFFASSLADSPGSLTMFCVWNVGQGQWITKVTADRCTHFDFGGEIQFFQTVQSRIHHLCSRKMNELYLERVRRFDS